MTTRIIALDADGVLLDYHAAYPGAWERAFGQRPVLKNPRAYWPIHRWDVRELEGTARDQLSACFDERFWSSIPALPGAKAACQRLVDAGFELVVVTAIKSRYASARRRNLQDLGFPLAEVISTEGKAGGASPKADAIARLAPLAFVDDYLPYHRGIPDGVHQALILREPEGSPNVGDELRLVDSQHENLAAFAQWWLSR